MVQEKIFKGLFYLGIVDVVLAWIVILISISANPWWISHYTTGAFSDLGSSQANMPWIYNNGLIFVGILILLYSISLINYSLNKIEVAGSAFFFIAGIFLILIGIFPAGTRPHVFVSTYFFVQSDLSIITWGIGIYLSKLKKYGEIFIILGIISPIVAILAPLSAAEAETLGILVIDAWTILMYNSLKRRLKWPIKLIDDWNRLLL